MNQWILSALVLITTSVSFASANIDSKSLIPLVSPSAKKGGTLSIALDSEPENLNPINSTDYYAQQVHDFTCDGLMSLNYDTYDWMPGLAESYEVGKDGMSYTFHLRKNAKFHDGTPVTAEDIKFAIDAVKDPKFKASHRLPYYENIGDVTVIDPYTVRFQIKQVYFNNFSVIVGNEDTRIVPKKQYGDPKKKMSKKLICSGPYKLSKYNKGKSIELVRNKDWWGWSTPYLNNAYNYDKIILRFVKEENLQLQMMEKGQIDFLPVGKEAFYKKTLKEPWGKTIKKIEVENNAPKGFGFVGWNLLDPKFQDKNVRQALTHLMNRELINEKFRYGKSALATGPWYRYSVYADQAVQPLKFDPELAKTMLDKTGWKDSDKDGVRDKLIDGKKTDFSFTLLLPTRDVEKYFTLYKEDLKKAGIRMDIKYVEWNTFLKSVDSKKFEALAMGWGPGSVHVDPKQIWHSSSARAGGSNFISYSNKEVDKLIDQARLTLSHNDRAKILRKVYRIIADDAPYLFMFNDPLVNYAISNKVGQVKETYRFGVGKQYWWSKNL
ncbi:MAG: peptide ABC transporter substrate-binding protein [Bdellovibrionales bacterium]|nr:peptide ABC transporter substrate-binding protein [Bdellovibrionales bacterium]